MKRTFISLFFLLLLIICSTSIHAQTQQIKGAAQLHATYLGTTRPLRTLTPAANTSLERRAEKKANKPSYTPVNFLGWDGPNRVNPNAKPQGADPVIQSSFPRNSILVEPHFVVEGLDEDDAAGVGVPDVNGEIGKDQFVQVVNASWIQIFGRDGSELTQAFSANTIWGEIGEESFSDPVIQYDEVADRWLVTDLASLSSILYAVSATPDPLGAYHAYRFDAPTLCDYPKYGITPTSYFVTVNPLSGEEPIYIFNRQQMLDGAEEIDVQQVDFPSIPGKFPTGTPADWNGSLMPFDDNLHMLRMKDDAWTDNGTDDILELWSIEVDWTDPDQTAATLTELVTEPFDADPCGNGDQTCIPQPSGGTPLDAIATIIMNKITQRNFGTHESIVLNFTVRPKPGGPVGIRWMELRRTENDPWSIYQEGTLSPADGLNRWLGAISINEYGSIGLAYAVSSETVNPSLRMTGRPINAPLGQMSVNEVELRTGEGVRGFSNRYGDYFAMTSDPLSGDFWFTGEYVKADQTWGTIVTAFSILQDTFDLSVTSLHSPEDGPMLSADETVAVTIRNNGLETQRNIALGYSFEGGAFVEEVAAIDSLKPDSTYTHTFDGGVDMSTIGSYDFIAYVRSDRDDSALNDTLRRTVDHQPNRDIAVLAAVDLPASLCDTTADFSVTVENVGADQVTSFSLDIFIDGVEAGSQDWSGMLDQGMQTNVQMTLVDLSLGQQNVDIVLSELNGTDDQVAVNDSLFVQVDVIDGGEATLVLVLDDFPNETTWDLLQDDDVIASGAGYTMQRDTIRESFCLKEGACYTFVLNDSYGDGLFIPGTYQILDQNGEVLASILDNDFGAQERNFFCVGSCLLDGMATVTDASGQDQPDGVILLGTTSGTGPFQYSIDSGMVFQSFPAFSNLLPGLYNVAIRGAGDCFYRDTVRVGFNSATVETGLETEGVHVYPNPSDRGVYTVQVNNFEEGGNTLDYKIVTTTGESLVYGRIPRVNSDYKGVVSIYKYPAGMYYLVFLDDRIERMVKLIKLYD